MGTFGKETGAEVPSRLEFPSPGHRHGAPRGVQTEGGGHTTCTEEEKAPGARRAVRGAGELLTPAETEKEGGDARRAPRTGAAGLGYP